MISREHEFGDMTVGPGMAGTSALITIAIRDTVMDGIPVRPYEILDRAEVERLRDLCEEALA